MCVILFCCLLSGVARANPTARPRKRREVIGFVRESRKKAGNSLPTQSDIPSGPNSIPWPPPPPSEKKKKKKIDVLSLSRIVGPINYLRCDNGQIVLVTFSRESEWLFLRLLLLLRERSWSLARWRPVSQSVGQGRRFVLRLIFFLVGHRWTMKRCGSGWVGVDW